MSTRFSRRSVSRGAVDVDCDQVAQNLRQLTGAALRLFFIDFVPGQAHFFDILLFFERIIHFKRSGRFI